ncbi:MULTISPECIES: glycosyltransferase family 2 protein [unclassified Synechococcus]|uniref:glycosyltransferase family 2 protein n=1 Tax=unclassified Synechococcus TaxID=2626047 RepID=UPI00006983C5|nr:MULTISPECIES: glycosyltransferase family 2 protein [unclassified Synechococcus]EAQ75838.1 probable glycosyl transferase [Synechococcus sp. WH 5701]WFN59513.1 glycosyltransferase family 2 protein [Synechococcus sp. CCFWC 502]
MISSPLVSIVVPFRDQGDYLIQAAHSLRSQTFPCWECLLVDDNSQAYARSCAQWLVRTDPRFRLLSIVDKLHAPGPWCARNVGIASARASLIAFLDADDLWHPCKLERQLPLHLDHAIEISVTAYHRFVDSSHQLIETRCPPTGLSYRQLLRGNVIPLSTVVVQRSWLEDPFRPERHEDYGLWLRLFERMPPPAYGLIREPLMAYRLHSTSLSAQRGRSIVAVERLFRRHAPSAWNRSLLVARWALARGCGFLVARMNRRLAPSQLLPEAFAASLSAQGMAASASGRPPHVLP